MKNVLAKFSIVFALLLLVACSGNSEEPSAVVDQFITLSNKGEMEEAYKLVCKKDQEKISLDVFKAQAEQLKNPLIQEFVAKAEHKIVDTQIDGDKAVVTVDQQLPDIAKVMQASIQVAMKNPNLKDQDEALKAVLDEFNGDVPMMNKTIKYNVYKEDGAWKIEFPKMF